jgi:WhiB family transcriptional regulator, redox-sensing transcriptional regulator
MSADAISPIYMDDDNQLALTLVEDFPTVTEPLMAIVDGEEIKEEPNWQERALCAQTDPEAFFPEKGGSTREAKKVCLSCDVRGECLEYALANDERHGIWGGLSERERRKVKKGRQQRQ